MPTAAEGLTLYKRNTRVTTTASQVSFADPSVTTVESLESLGLR
ncbi:Uncharacterised protein [Chlamydia trachomatis]|nr:Uncharacterised protein [Chlamydia trachomatis]CRH49090.1 Uncharacterised protein [Chlamydia trachomatis]